MLLKKILFLNGWYSRHSSKMCGTVGVFFRSEEMSEGKILLGDIYE